MNTLLRNKRPLYLCKKYVDEETNVTKFEKPKKPLVPTSEANVTFVNERKFILNLSKEEICAVS